MHHHITQISQCKHQSQITAQFWIFCWHMSILGSLIPCFKFLVMSLPDYKDRVCSLIHHWVAYDILYDIHLWSDTFAGVYMASIVNVTTHKFSLKSSDINHFLINGQQSMRIWTSCEQIRQGFMNSTIVWMNGTRTTSGMRKSLWYTTGWCDGLRGRSSRLPAPWTYGGSL